MVKKRISEIYDEMLYKVVIWIIGHSMRDRVDDLKERICRLEEGDDIGKQTGD